MKQLALIAMVAVMSGSVHAQADGVQWPVLKPGEVKIVEDLAQVPAITREAAGNTSADDLSHKVTFTFFKAPQGRDFVVIDPCCGPKGNGASLFEFSESMVKAVALAVGDPRAGFHAQAHADSIRVDAGAAALRARIAFPDCEDGVWGYYYHFDEADRPVLLSVIDTSCAHLGVRELYHAMNIDLGHWWQR